MPKPVYELDGRSFGDLETFSAELSRVLGTSTWGTNLDVLHDILRGGFGTPDGGFVLRWLHSDASRVALGYDAMVAYLESILATCHPANVAYVAEELAAARRHEGATLFDLLLEILRIHGPGGEEHACGVELELR